MARLLKHVLEKWNPVFLTQTGRIAGRIKTCRSGAALPCCRASTCFLMTFSLVALACLVFDRATGSMGRFADPTARAWAHLLSDVRNSGWCLLISAFLALEGMTGAVTSQFRRARARAMFFSLLGLYCFLSIALSGLLANLLKRAIGRARPGEFAVEDPFHFMPFAGRSGFESFPSGHSTTIGAVFMILALLAPRYRLFFAVAALWCGMARVMVGAHYPSDVLAGLAFGAWFTWAMALCFARYRFVFRRHGQSGLMLRQRLLPNNKAAKRPTAANGDAMRHIPQTTMPEASAPGMA
ncbi:phosphatase PAP2 family protein [Allorhizobium undicola]|uniref:phosphatase PAP2 family protein n=1 Tax=Allorhizobium undicola TaxID=78527 RepID=UPI003D348606